MVNSAGLALCLLLGLFAQPIFGRVTLLPEDTCGQISISNKNNKIVAFPWQVEIDVMNGDTLDSVTCYGTLISSKWVMTNRECLFSHTKDLSSGEFEEIIQNIHVTLTIGKTTLSSGERRELDYYVWHDDFDPKTGDNDIVLLGLETRLYSHSQASPACLPWNLRDSELNGKLGQSFKWEEDDLIQKDVTLFDSTSCKMFNPLVTSEEICALGDKETLKTNVGSSIVYKSTDSKYYAVGLIRGPKSDSSASPATVSSILKVLDWIKENSHDEKFPQM